MGVCALQYRQSERFVVKKKHYNDRFQKCGSSINSTDDVLASIPLMKYYKCC